VPDAGSTTPLSRRAAPLPPDERRAAIVTAVLPLIVELGHAVTSRQLAEAAGGSEGTIFNVFADKDELITAVLDAALDQAPFEQSVAAIDRTVPLREQLVAATELIQHRIVDVWRLLSSVGPRPEESARPLPISAELTALFADHPHEITVEPVEAARLLRAMTLSLTHPLLTAQPLDAERIVEVFLHGVGGRG
jgi:AcrR family transcriptional regulator